MNKSRLSKRRNIIQIKLLSRRQNKCTLIKNFKSMSKNWKNVHKGQKSNQVMTKVSPTKVLWIFQTHASLPSMSNLLRTTRTSAKCVMNFKSSRTWSQWLMELLTLCQCSETNTMDIICWNCQKLPTRSFGRTTVIWIRSLMTTNNDKISMKMGTKTKTLTYRYHKKSSKIHHFTQINLPVKPIST